MYLSLISLFISQTLPLFFHFKFNLSKQFFSMFKRYGIYAVCFLLNEIKMNLEEVGGLEFRIYNSPGGNLCKITDSVKSKSIELNAIFYCFLD